MVSHKYECIFTHIPKTAGKSIRYLFGLPQFEHEYEGATDDTIEFGFGHTPLSKLIEKDYFREYFKFSFVRNPFDRLVSAYHYLNCGGCNEADKQFRDDYLAIYKGEFAAFVEDLCTLVTATHFQPQIDWVCDDRRSLLTNFIGRYESIGSDMAIVSKRLGLPPKDIPIINASNHRAYRYYYDDATRQRVCDVYGEDLEMFSYGF
jgi:chondroitin 4-sulfotransferase 11